MKVIAVVGCLMLYVFCLFLFLGLFGLPWDVITWP